MFAREIEYVGFSLHTRLEKGKFEKRLRVRGVNLYVDLQTIKYFNL